MAKIFEDFFTWRSTMKYVVQNTHIDGISFWMCESLLDYMTNFLLWFYNQPKRHYSVSTVIFHDFQNHLDLGHPQMVPDTPRQFCLLYSPPHSTWKLTSSYCSFMSLQTGQWLILVLTLMNSWAFWKSSDSTYPQSIV